MAKYRPKDQEIEAQTFDEFVQHMKENTPYPHWHIVLNGTPFTHENDSKYLFHGVNNTYFQFTPDQMLCENSEGKFYLKDKTEFDRRYEKV
jgi:hypothetical protein